VYVSVDPYLFQYALLQPENVGVVKSRGVGVVEESRCADYPVGCVVYGTVGWATHSVLAARAVVAVTMADGSIRAAAGSDGLRILNRPVSVSASAGSPLRRYLGVLGVPGLTGYAGVKRLLAPKPGAQVFVSSAAGAVGLVAGQVAKIFGAGKVVGSTSTDEKCQFLLDHGFDAAINYRKLATPGYDGYYDALAGHFPDGIDGYFDCVGGVRDGVVKLQQYQQLPPLALTFALYGLRTRSLALSLSLPGSLAPFHQREA
jgi:NADPH-dependent curcumin reductase CurA